MGLRLKFNLFLSLSLLLMLLLLYHFQQRKVRALEAMEVEQQAALLYQLTESIRHYNMTEVTPLLEQLNRGFLPQAVGSYAASQTMAKLSAGLPQFSYKVAIKDSSIERYRPNVWQQNLIGLFTTNPAMPRHTQQLADASGTFYVYAKPIHDNDAVIGAKIMRIDLSSKQNQTNQSLLRFAWLLAALWLLTLLIINLLLHVLVIKPLKAMALQAELISQGQAEIDELEIRGRDEISRFGQAFNRLQRSLKAAMSMLS